MTLLVPQAEGITLPRSSPLARPFWDACKEHRLLYQRCARCDQAVFNPAPICPACLSRDLAWHESAGLGAIYSWTIAHRPMTPAFTVPYAPIIVDDEADDQPGERDVQIDMHLANRLGGNERLPKCASR